MNDNDEFRDITRRLYAVISQPAGERDWESIRHFYHPRATMVRTGIGEDGQPFVLAMTFRGFVTEGFVIPTGSMAPTLYGRHIDFTCEQCGNKSHER